MGLYVDRTGVEEAYADRSWQRVLFNEFAATLTSTARPFPCIFGTAGFKANQLRFAFPDRMDAATVATILSAYLPAARGYGQNTSLVLIGRPGPVQPIASYRAQFWSLLRELATLDSSKWPEEIPDALDSPSWEFCFGGEPIFVVCNSPAHVLRQSRRASSFMLTFQPRWVFDKLLSTPKAAKAAFAAVREHLARYDLLPEAPALGHYGDPNNREFAQYFLEEDNSPAKCPFATMRSESAIVNSEEKIAC